MILMGQVPERDTERDKALINDYKLAVKLNEPRFLLNLQNKYQLSASRIYQILENYGVMVRKDRKGKDYGKGKRK